MAKRSLKFLPLGVFDTSVKIKIRNKQTSRFNLNFLIARIRRVRAVSERASLFGPFDLGAQQICGIEKNQQTAPFWGD